MKKWEYLEIIRTDEPGRKVVSQINEKRVQGKKLDFS